jgi:hypothetical protein
MCYVDKKLQIQFRTLEKNIEKQLTQISIVIIHGQIY